MGFDDIAAGIVDGTCGVAEFIGGFDGLANGVVDGGRFVVVRINGTDDLAGGIVYGLGGDGADVGVVIRIGPLIAGTGLVAIVIVGEGTGKTEGVCGFGEVAATVISKGSGGMAQGILGASEVAIGIIGICAWFAPRHWWWP